MQEEIESKIVAVSIRTAERGAKFTEELLRKAVRKLLTSLKNNRNKTYQGKQSMKHLMRQNQQLSSVDVEKENMRAFNRTAVKYGIDYTVMKDKADEGHFIVFFKARDNEVLTRAFHEFCGEITINDQNTQKQEQQKSEEKEQEKSEERESVHEKLEEKKQEVKEREEKRKDKNRQKKREKDIER